MPSRPIALSQRVLDFAAHLRAEGFVVGPAEVADAVKLLDQAPPDRARTRAHLKVLIASTHDQWQRFDPLFDAFWRAATHGHAVAQADAEASVVRPAARASGTETRLDETGGRRDAITSDAAAPEGAGASGATSEALFAIDLADLTDPRELAKARRIARRIAAAMRTRLSRRWRRTQSGHRLDMRAIVRQAMARGGEPAELVLRARARRPLPVFVLLDVSGSMNAYTPVYLSFVRGLAGQWIDARVHLMHTALVDASDALRQRDDQRAIARFAAISAGIGGGTRLGSCLCTFNRAYGSSGLLRRAVVIVFSDGYDSGPEATFEREFAELAARARHVVWLNPLKGRFGYRPVTLAMRSALAHIDHFAAANTLAALASLEGTLARLRP